MINLVYCQETFINVNILCIGRFWKGWMPVHSGFLDRAHILIIYLANR